MIITDTVSVIVLYLRWMDVLFISRRKNETYQIQKVILNTAHIGGYKVFWETHTVWSFYPNSAAFINLFKLFSPVWENCSSGKEHKIHL